MEHQNFCLKWESFQSNVTSVFEDLRQEDELVDITLCCEGERFPAHRMMLSACSPYFRDVLKSISCQHMVFYMRDTSASDLRALLEFMYKGKVNVSQNQLGSFIKTAEALQIRGLSGDEEPSDQHSQHTQPSTDKSRSASSAAAGGKRQSSHYDPPAGGDAGGAFVSSGGDRHHRNTEANTARAAASLSSGTPTPSKRRRRNSGAQIGTTPQPSEVVDLEESDDSEQVWSNVQQQQPPSPQPVHPSMQQQTLSAQPPHPPMAAAWSTEPDVDGSLVNPSPVKMERNSAASADTSAVSPSSLPHTVDSLQSLSTDAVKVEKVDIVESPDDLLEATFTTGQVEDCDDYSEADRVTVDSLMMANMGASVLGGAGPSQMLPSDDPQGSQGVSDTARFFCPICQRSYRHRQSYSSHLKLHQGLTSCPVCNKVLSKVSNLRVHLAMKHEWSREQIAQNTRFSFR